MKMIELLSQSEVEEVSLIIQCLLDRVPVIIEAKKDEFLRFAIDDLLNLFSFRNRLVYNTDFSGEEDYNNIIENEENDFEIKRSFFLCYSEDIRNALHSINKYKSWVFGILQETNQELQQELKSRILEQDKFFLTIDVTETQLKTNIEATFFPNMKLQFERHIYQNAIFSTEISVEKMKRIISKRIKINDIGKENFTSLMNFDVEESELKENIIKKELINFYEASKRTFNILIRLRNIESMGFPTNLSERTLFQTIAYKLASLERIFRFIFAEWNINFTEFMDHNKISNFSDTLESLWG